MKNQEANTVLGFSKDNTTLILCTPAVELALKQIKDTNKYTEDLIANFNEAIKGMDDVDPARIEEAMEMINKIKEGFGKL